MDGLITPESDLLHHLVETAVFLAVTAIGTGVVVLIRRRVLPRSELLSVAATVLAVYFFGAFLLGALGLHTTSVQASSLLLVPGSLFGHARPRSIRALCRTLALFSGVIAGFAFLDGQYLGAAVALGVTGGLAVLAEHVRSRAPVPAKP